LSWGAEVKNALESLQLLAHSIVLGRGVVGKIQVVFSRIYCYVGVNNWGARYMDFTMLHLKREDGRVNRGNKW